MNRILTPEVVTMNMGRGLSKLTPEDSFGPTTDDGDGGFRVCIKR